MSDNTAPAGAAGAAGTVAAVAAGAAGGRTRVRAGGAAADGGGALAHAGSAEGLQPHLHLRENARQALGLDIYQCQGLGRCLGAQTCQELVRVYCDRVLGQVGVTSNCTITHSLRPRAGAGG